MLSFPSRPTLRERILSQMPGTRSLAARAAARAEAGRTASLIIPRLYLSNYMVASDEDILHELGITHIISVTEYPPEYEDGKYKTLRIELEDSFRANILQHLDVTTEFIKSALEENETNKVLVHCVMGISRSATVVCAYLVATTPMIASEAIEYVIDKRSIVSPNTGFRSQLETYAVKFYGKGLRTKGNVKARFSETVVDRVRRLKGQKSAQLTGNDDVSLESDT